MCRFLFFSVLLHLAVAGFGQNLVINGGAEIIDSCNIGYSDIHVARGWFRPTIATSDLFHRCAIDTLVGVPNSAFGYQEPHTGDGFFGLHAGYSITYDYHEYISRRLKEPLVKGEVYCVSFYTASANDSSIINCATDQLGVLFTKDSIHELQVVRLEYTPQIFSKKGEVIDTLGWTFVQDTFTAKGGENYITIGQFFDFQTLAITKFHNGEPGNGLWDEMAYYFIDDIEVVVADENCSVVGPNFNSILELPNVFTPNQPGGNQLYRIQARNLAEFDIKIYNRWGNLVFESDYKDFEWDGTSNGKELAAGVYFVVVKAVGFNGKKLDQNISLSLFR